jgi:hypothetical protein
MFSVTTFPAALNLYKNNAISYAIIRSAVYKLLQHEANMQIKMFEMTVRTWVDSPIFNSDIQGDEPMILQVGTSDKVYYFLNYGTRVRRALMSDDFVPKTSPGSLKSRAGRGHRVKISKNISRPGIEARHFAENIYDVRRPIFMKNFKSYIIPYATQLLFGKNVGPPPNRFWR